jgi:hypothetical protein
MKINQLTKSAGIGVFFLFANLNAQSSDKIIRNFIKTMLAFKNNQLLILKFKMKINQLV